MKFDPNPAVRVLATLAASCLSMLVLTNPASGQCGPQLRGGDGLLGPDGAVNAIHEWDPDGNGPLPPLVVLGGVFHRVNDHFVSRLIGYEPVSRQWIELGTPPPVSGSHCFATLPGCSLLASPDAVVFTASSGGSVATGFSIPLDAAFVGVQLQHQVLEVELAAGLTVSRVAASNALTLTIGSL